MKDKSFETPFGAYDSELCGFEYTIPEGFIAEIKDGKVIVKRQESEDERIRKAFIKHLTTYKENYGGKKWYDIEVDTALAYIEKQKVLTENGDGLYYYHKDGSFTFMSRPAMEENLYDFAMSQQKEKQKEPTKKTPAWMPKFLDELRTKSYLDWDEHKDMEGGVLAIIRWIAPDYFGEKQKENTKSADSLLCDLDLFASSRDDCEKIRVHIRAIRKIIAGIPDEQQPAENPKWDELTWKDINELERIINNVHYEFPNGIGQESFGKEVLEKFRDTKDDANVDSYEHKPAELSTIDDKIQYASIEGGIKAHAETYSFNTDSQLFPLLTKEQQLLWRKEIEQAVISGGEIGVELSNDKRYKQPAEWSEEDEKMKNNTILSLQSLIDEGINTEFIKGVEKEITWLKSLHPQPQLEWSEEDEKIFNHIIYCAENRGWIPFNEINWLKTRLKSIRPQPHWKPSEEQMKALKVVARGFPADDPGVIDSLLADLQKLL